MSVRYEHQQLEPASTWIVRHNLFTRAPVVDAYVEIDGVVQKILPKAVKPVSLTECHIEWSVPRAGRAGVA
jgi:hypothetical protein